MKSALKVFELWPFSLPFWKANESLTLTQFLNEMARIVPPPFIAALANIAVTLQLTIVFIYMKLVYSVYRMKIGEIRPELCRFSTFCF